LLCLAFWANSFTVRRSPVQGMRYPSEIYEKCSRAYRGGILGHAINDLSRMAPSEGVEEYDQEVGGCHGKLCEVCVALNAHMDRRRRTASLIHVGVWNDTSLPKLSTISVGLRLCSPESIGVARRVSLDSLNSGSRLICEYPFVR
jgi:hypothetical protein